ncbi:MAG: ATP-NAD kinase family protein [Methanospirillaceae archaeon]|nr:ATP-NAD kinase family protein [Methanospirillaceae archaeon]
MSHIGFLINPVAGMGGAVGLKGTDGKYEEAILKGATEVAPKKAQDFLSHLPRSPITWVTAGGAMGADILIEFGAEDIIVISSPASPSSRKDTEEACRLMEEKGVDLILFCGGDGTARDVACSVHNTPILGIPAGVKMFSGVFSSTPASAAAIVSRILDLPLCSAEVLDIDEEAYRQGILHPKLYATVQIPFMKTYCPGGKITLDPANEQRSRQEIASFIISLMRDDTLYLIGAGETTAAIAEGLQTKNTLLGIDALYQKKTIQQDLSEEDILKLMEIYPRVQIILSPIGSQGFILGRGNQQVSPRVLAKTGPSGIIVIATPAKLQLTRKMYLDSGDTEINASFGNTISVVCGNAIAQRMPLYTT